MEERISARHQSGVLVAWGEGAGGGRILLDTGAGLDIVCMLIKALSSQRRPPSDETRVYADRRVLAVVEELFGAIATAVPRLYGDKLRWIEAADGERVEIRGGPRLTTFLVDHEPPAGGR